MDKTGHLLELVSGKRGSRFFISRPRRFGKSLMLSTLAAIFRGERELFDDLEISRRGYLFSVSPVVLIDMTSVLASTADALERNLLTKVGELAQDFAIDMKADAYATAGTYFGAFLHELFARKGKIVVLVDEYDAPVNKLIAAGASAEAARGLLHDFYVQLKVHDDKIRFVMMTGVSKFAKLSVFSGLNNLTDLTFAPECSDLLGYTREEILENFGEHMAAFADLDGNTIEAELDELLSWYDGYRFSPRSDVRVTNPVSLGRALDSQYVQNYWDETGNATVVYEVLKRRRIIPAELNEVLVSVADLDVCDAHAMKTPSLLFQGGYLTIDAPLASGMLKLRLPNREVDASIHSGLLSYLIGERSPAFIDFATSAGAALRAESGTAAEVIGRTLHAAFALIPHEWKIADEAEAKRMFLFYCKFLGADITGEVQSCRGRADAVLKLDQAIYVFEFKYAQSTCLAADQALARSYADPYLDDVRAVFRVGVNFDPVKRNIDAPIVEKVKDSGIGVSSDESSGEG